MAMVNRFDVHIVATRGDSTGICVVISPDEMNRHLTSAIIAPVVPSGRGLPTRVEFVFMEKERQIILDQLRTVDQSSLQKKIGELDAETRAKTLEKLAEMFAA
jgi:mRNA interferase MazF